jgi:protein TonB
MQVNQEVVELSDTPVDASLFAIPTGYTAAPADELIRGMIQTSQSPSAAGAGNAGTPAARQRIRVDGNVQQAKLIRQSTPIYPEEAKAAHISGRVILRVVVGKDGTVRDVSLVGGHPLLVAPAKEAVKQWVYQPTLLNGEPVEVLTQVEVNFTLSQ